MPTLARRHAPPALPRLLLRRALTVAATLALQAAAVAAPPARYAEPVAPPPRAPLAARVEEALVEQAKEQHRSPLVVEPRLEWGLAALSPQLPPSGAPPAELVQQAMWLAGLVEPMPYVLVLSVSDGGDADVLQQVRAEAKQVLEQADYRRVACVVTELGPSRQRVLVALEESFVELEPVPRQVPAGTQLTVAGRVAPSFQRPELFVTAPDGSVVGARVAERAVAGGARFSGAVRCAAVGRHQLEIVAEGRFGSTVLANFPLYCGVPAPRDLIGPTHIAPQSEPRPWRDEADAERRVLDLVNRDRAAAGRPPLVADSRLAEVARAHSRDMRDHGFVGHTSPTTGSPSDRVARAKLEAPIVLLENVGAGASPEQVEQGMMGSPAHRANVTSAEVDRVGIGVAAQTSSPSGSEREIYVTQLFARFPPPFDATRAPEQLRERVAQLRRGAGAPPLAADAGLEASALALARSLADGTTRPEHARPVLEGDAARRFATVRTLVVSAAAVDELPASASLLDRSMTHSGVAALRGHAKGADIVWLVVLLARTQ